jgi:Family of unknown function (DUF6481)
VNFHCGSIPSAIPPNVHECPKGTALTKFSFNNFADRQSSSAEARKALLNKFKNRPTDEDPVAVARKAEREAIVKARMEREAAKRADEERQAKLKAEQDARDAAERAAREAQLEAERAARIAARAQIIAQASKGDMDWKMQRLAARKKR